MSILIPLFLPVQEAPLRNWQQLLNFIMCNSLHINKYFTFQGIFKFRERKNVTGSHLLYPDTCWKGQKNEKPQSS
jgi:hypothetical protein